MTRHKTHLWKTRLWVIIGSLACLGLAVGLVLRAFSSNIVFFMAPSQIRAHPPPPERTVRLGGMVVAGSFRRILTDGTPVNLFTITDGQTAIPVRYVGILPDLFREGQSVVTLGTMSRDGHFTASDVLAKHDETYMPKDVADALRRSGQWDPRFGKAPDTAHRNTMIVPSHPPNAPPPNTKISDTGG